MEDASGKKRLGRPPAGLGKKGEPDKIKDYPRLSLTVRPAVKAKLDVVAALERRPTWKVVEDGIELYIAQMNPSDRRAVEAVGKRATAALTASTEPAH